ncbi:hypothetical protein ACVWWQ_001266 [Rhodanobacter sp. TND4EL1]
MNITRKLHRAAREFFIFCVDAASNHDEMRIAAAMGAVFSINDRKNYSRLSDLELKVFSQFGDDGIIQYLTHRLDLKKRTFIEFGVGDYFESNTRFLLQKDNWSGFVMDGSSKNIDRLKGAYFFWRHDVCAEACYITRENVAALLQPHVSRWNGDPDLLHIDLDGNDYWIWKQLELRPTILILEYNGTFGIDRSISVPYQEDFNRTEAHYSNVYWGASLNALHELSKRKGYVFIGCNSAGNNAYFIRQDKMNSYVREVTLEEGYVEPKYRESRNKHGELTFLSIQERRALIRGMAVFNTQTDNIEVF